MEDIPSSAIREDDTEQRQGLEEQHTVSPSFKRNKHTGALKQTAQSTPSPNQLPIRQKPCSFTVQTTSNRRKWKPKYITQPSLINTRHTTVVRLATTEKIGIVQLKLKPHTIAHDQQTDTVQSLCYDNLPNYTQKIISNHPTDTYNGSNMYHITTKEIAQTQQKVHPTKTPMLQDIRQIADT